ncbi:MAG TPA: hypothetical protein ENH84_06855 [Phycisphaerae bacterium]|nr:hypothetical protein [Phycisphaerae bacterium]
MAMTEKEVFKKLVPLIREVTGVRADEVTMDSYLMRDLGAESIDLLDLSFLIEETFRITLEADEFESRTQQSISGADYERDGYLTAEALTELQNALPEIDPGLLREGLRKIEVPGVLNVAVFVHLIQRKLASQTQETHHA